MFVYDGQREGLGESAEGRLAEQRERGAYLRWWLPGCGFVGTIQEGYPREFQLARGTENA